jgi:hypothetical protein
MCKSTVASPPPQKKLTGVSLYGHEVTTGRKKKLLEQKNLKSQGHFAQVLYR